MVRPCAHLRPSSIAVGSATPRNSRLGAFKQGIRANNAPRAFVFYHPSGKQICCVARTVTTPGNAQKIVEDCGDDIEPNTRSQPMDTLSAFTKDGCAFDPILPAAGTLVSRSPLSVRSRLETIPAVLGKSGNETRMIEKSNYHNDCAPRYRFAHQSLPSLRTHTPAN